MAKTKTFEPRQVKSKEDRNKGRSGFITLKKTGDEFLGYALGIADPDVEDNKGYYEYYEHYTPETGYCACAADEDGNGCPLCDDGDNPSTRAKTLWLVVDADDPDPDKGEIKVFNMNYYVIQEFAEDGSDMLGRLYRIKKKEGNGQFTIRPKPDKLTKKQLSAALKDIDDDHLRALTTKQMNRVLKELGAEAAMEEDDDESETEDEPKAKKGSKKTEAKADKKSSKKSSKKDEPEEEAEEEEADDDAFDPESATEFEDLVVQVTKLTKKKNLIEAVCGEAEFEVYGTDDVDFTDLKKGDWIKVDATKDEDDDFVADAFEETEEPEEEEDEDESGGDDNGEVPPNLSEEVVEIKAVNEEEETLLIVTDDGTEIELFFSGEGEDSNGREWTELDMSDFKKGMKVTVTSHIDEDGDMLADTFPEPVKSGGKSSKKDGGKKTSGKKKK